MAAASCSLILSACGGGGAGGADGASGAGGGTPPSSDGSGPGAVARSFADIQAPAGFSWSTVNEAPRASLTISRAGTPTGAATGAMTGAVRVVISNFIEVDPTGSGARMDPMSTDVIASTLGTPAGSAPTSVRFDRLRLPAGTSEVLLEVFDLDSSTRLAWRKVTLTELSSGAVALSI